MSLYQNLQKAQSEEDIKAAYIRSLQLKDVTQGFVDIQTPDIWFEAKYRPTDVYTMFTQLLYYVFHDYELGKSIPKLLGVADSEKAALMSTEKLLPFFESEKNVFVHKLVL